MLRSKDAIAIFDDMHKTMKYKVSDFVIYRTENSGEIFTWIKQVYEDERHYILDYDDSQAREDEIHEYSATNFSAPPANGIPEIDVYHRDTMIDRIVSALQSSNWLLDLKVSKSAGAIVFDTVITDPNLFKDQNKLQEFVGKFNRIIARVQEKFNKRWNTEIPVQLRFPLDQIKLNPITI